MANYCAKRQKFGRAGGFRKINLENRPVCAIILDIAPPGFSGGKNRPATRPETRGERSYMEDNQDYETIDLLELLGVVRRHIVALLLTTVLAAAAGFAVSKFLMTPQYQASALMIVNTRQDTTANVTSDQLNSASKLVSTYSIIVKSDTVLNQVIANLGLNMSYETLAGKVGVAAVDDTQVMEITVTDANPDGARQVCEQITQVAPDAILTAVEAGSVKVISAASVDPDPVSPNVMRNTAIAGVLGLVVCLGVLFLQVLLDNKINTEEDVTKQLGLNVIGVIPDYENGGKK